MMVICIKQQLSNVWRLVHENLGNTEGDLKKGVVYKKKCLKLNCRRFSYFQLFSHDIIKQNTIQDNICIFIGVILQARRFGRGRE